MEIILWFREMKHSLFHTNSYDYIYINVSNCLPQHETGYFVVCMAGMLIRRTDDVWCLQSTKDSIVSERIMPEGENPIRVCELKGRIIFCCCWKIVFIVILCGNQ